MSKQVLNITTSLGTINRRIKEAINADLKSGGAPNLTDIKFDVVYKIQKFLILKFMESETYFSLTDGELRAEFGLDDYEVSLLPWILESIILPSIVVSPVKKNQMLTIAFASFDYNDIDFDQHGTYISEKSGKVINWLQWLLTADENIVVEDYFVLFKQGAGRSHMAIMVKQQDSTYSVDGYFAGKLGDNWITRTLRQYSKEVLSIISEVLGAP